MRICVYGAGAIGGNFATRLAAAGNDVSVVVRGAHLDAIRANGLTMHSGDKAVVAKVEASDKPAELGPQDVVLVTLKSSSQHVLPAAIGPLLRRDTMVAFVQNGIPWWYGDGLNGRPAAPDLSRLDPGGAIRRAVGPERTIGAVVTSSNQVIAPGVIKNISPDRNTLWVAETDDRQSARVLELRKTLVAAGIASPATTDIRYDIWNKLMSSLSGGALTLILREKEPVLGSPIINPLVRCAHREALAIAAAHGVVLDDNPEVRYGPKRVYPDHRVSILQDYELGRPMEIESIVRAPLAFARKAGLATPTLDAIEAICVQLATSKGLYRGETA
jgi:2-dehydropantoate 2-reductase